MPNAFSYDCTLYSLRLLLRHSSFFSLLRHRHRFSMWATQILLTTHTQTHTHTQVLSQSHKLMCCLIHRRRKHTRTRRKNHRFFEIWSLFFSFRFCRFVPRKHSWVVRNNKQKIWFAHHLEIILIIYCEQISTEWKFIANFVCIYI